MTTNKIQDFFNGRFFVIPKYQRGYAWERQQVQDLFDDIMESIETNSDHYIGTIVLSKTDDKVKYFVVDGQQRITTITMIISRLIDAMDEENASYYRRFYIKKAYDYRLSPLSRDGEYFRSILGGESPEPKNKSQRFLRDAAEVIDFRVQNIADKLKFMERLEGLQIVEFVEDTEGDAIRIFQTVNDRGKPLSNMEKAKSLLIYFSNRYLNKALDDSINECFSDIFEIYDDIKHVGEDVGINLINSKDFNEDNIMRYHFVTFCGENYDPTASYVFGYLKSKLSKLRSEGRDGKPLSDFISSYIDSLRGFFASCKSVILRTNTEPSYYKLFCILNLSATLYPLIVKLEQKSLLEKPVTKHDSRTFFDMIETIDVRVYKTRATDPKAHIGAFVCSIDGKNEGQVAEWLLWFNEHWMSNDSFASYLSEDMYQNKSITHIFIECCETLQQHPYSIDELKKITAASPTIEHILSQTPQFKPRAFGFKGQQDYELCEDTIGNLTLLERRKNSSIQNKNPIEKVDVYGKSTFKITKKVGSYISESGGFTKIELKKRTTELCKYLAERWRC